MSKLTDTPYSAITENKLAYKIMLIRDHYEIKFTDIAKDYGMPVIEARQMYNRTKIKQINLYIDHLSIVFGHKNTSQMRKIYDDAYNCYRSRRYACAYLEKRYREILTEYRNGEPGMPARFIKSMPAFRSRTSDKDISRIVEMRDIGKESFTAIAKELEITQAKARHIYEEFYHKRVFELIKE